MHVKPSNFKKYNSIFAVAIFATIMIIVAVVCGVATMGCDTAKEAEQALIASASGKTSMTIPSDWSGKQNSMFETIKVYKDQKVQNKNYVEVAVCDESGTIDGTYQRLLKSYSPSSGYTYENLKQDIDTAATNPDNSLSNQTDVTLLDSNFYKVDNRTNAEDANYYFGIVNDKPVGIHVVGNEIKDSAEVSNMISSIVCA